MTMARRLKYVILIALVASIGLGVGFSLFRAHLLERPELLLEEVAKRVDLSLQDIDYTQISDGRKEWSLKAKQVDVDQAQDVFTLREVRVTVFRPTGETVSIRGDEGLFNRKKGWIKLLGRAEVKSDEGYTLKADKFLYRLNEQLLTSADPVSLTGPGVKITGRGLKVDVAKMKATILENVKTELGEAADKIAPPRASG